MTVRAAWVGMPLAIVGATLLLAVFHNPSSANDSATWNFEGEDAREGWTPVNTIPELAPGKGSDSSTAVAISPELPGWATLQRDVMIVPGYRYSYGGDYVSQAGGIHRIRLRTALFDSKGTFLKPAPNREAYAPERLSGSFDAPCGAVLGRFGVRVDGVVGSTAFVDDLFLKESAAWTICPTPPPTPPPTPTLTPTPIASPTPMSTPTSAPIATLAPETTPTASSTSTNTPTATPTPTPTPSSALDSTATATAPTADAQTPSPTPRATQPALPAATATATATATANPTSTSTPTPVENVAPVALDFELRNAGFEDGADGQPSAWETVGGLLMQAGSPARNGSWSGAFFSSTASTKWAYQTVAVTPASWYRYDAFIYHDDPWVASALLRISWFASADGSGSAVATVDSTGELTSSEPGFRSLSTGPVMAPPGVHSAKLRVLIRPRDATNAVIYIDDVSFASATVPATPAAPAPTATATPPATTLPPITPSPPAAPTIATPIAATSTPPLPTMTAVRVDTFTPPPTPTPTAVATIAEQHSGPSRELANAGFEEASDGTLAGWRTYGGLLTQTASPTRSGGAAGAFLSSSGSTKWVFQTVAVDPAAWYQFDAFVYHAHAWVESAFLRISWYTSEDGSGSALASVDSTALLTTPEPTYRPLSTGAVQSPPGARSAKLRVLMRPRDGTSALIYIDDASFRRVAEPAFTPAQQDVEQSAAPRVASSPQAPASAVGEPLAVVRPQPARAPMPAPVIRRHSLRTPNQLATPRDNDGPLWPWALFGAATGAGVVGWTSYLAQRLREGE